MTNDRNAWVLRMVDRLEDGLRENAIGIGWKKAKGLETIHEWDKFKDVVRTAYPNLYASNQALGNVAGSIWRFMREMKKGDYVVIPGHNGFYVAETLENSPYYDDKGYETDFSWRRKVAWLNSKEPIPRSFAKNELQRRMKARQTCVSATDLVDEIQSAITRKKPINFTEEVLRGSYDGVVAALNSAITDFGLEYIVKNLAEASGAKANVQGKNQKMEGDIDVLAIYDLNIAQEDATVRVGYQVKQHDSKTDDWAINQLIPRLELGDIDRGVVVTTANGYSENAENLAKDYEITLISLTELVEWIMTVGLGKIQDLPNQ